MTKTSLSARFPSLRNRAVFVTGGGSGIGADIEGRMCTAQELKVDAGWA